MPPLLRPAMIPSSPSATLRTAAASVTIENAISAALAAARGVWASRIPALTSGSAFACDRFQPVTVCPAAMSRGTIPAPMAPSPMKAMFMGPPRAAATPRSALPPSGRLRSHLLGLVAVGTQLVIAVHRNIEVVAVGVDRPVLGVETVARALERRTIAFLLEARRDLLIVFDLEAEMVEPGRFAVNLVGVNREVEIAVGERDAAVLGAVLHLQPHHLDVELHHPLDVGGVKHDVADLGHGSSDVRLRSECRRLSCHAHWRYRLVRTDPSATWPHLFRPSTPSFAARRCGCPQGMRA